MSQIAKEFFRDWVEGNLDPEVRPEANVSNLLMEAEEAGISQDELTAAVGDLTNAMLKAMAKASRS